jgi:hypothetical protein
MRAQTTELYDPVFVVTGPEKDLSYQPQQSRFQEALVIA